MSKCKNYALSLAHLIEQNAKMWSNAGRLNIKKNLRSDFGYDDFLVMDIINTYRQADIDFIAKILCKQKSYIDKIITGLLKKKIIQENENKFKLTSDGIKLYKDMLITHNKLVNTITRFFTENDIETLYRLQHKLQTVMLSLCNSDLI